MDLKKIALKKKTSRNCRGGLGNVKKLPRRVRNDQKLPPRVSAENRRFCYLQETLTSNKR